MKPRDPKPKSTVQPSPADILIGLTVERITITGVELSPLEMQRFEALLITELKRHLTDQFAVKDAEVVAESLRFDLSEITLNLDQPGDVNEAASEIARRLARTLESAVTKGAP